MNRNLKGALKSKFKSHFKIEIEKGTLKLKFKGTWGELWGTLGNLGNFEGTFNLVYFDGGTRGDAPGGTNRGGAQRPAIKTLSKNPFKLRLVRE